MDLQEEPTEQETVGLPVSLRGTTGGAWWHVETMSRG